jgi:LacI family transcriptional regulator
MGADKGGRQRRRRGPTLADVARRAGVSQATVSYVLNGRPGVSEPRRLEVLRAARELGFRPNRAAQALRGGASRVFGVLLGELSNPAYWDFSASVIETAAEHDYQVLLAYAGDVAKEDQVRALLAHQVDGLIVTTAVEDDRPLLRELSLRDVPFVLAQRDMPGFPADFVGIDQEAGARAVVEHLLSLGHRDVGILSGPQRSDTILTRVAAYRAALVAAGIEPGDIRFAEGESTQESGYTMARAMLRSPARRPSALVCANDLIALGAIDAAWDLGLAVPGDVAIVGFDDVSLAAARPIQLTSVRVPRLDVGRAAIHLLLERLADPELPPRRVVLPHRVIVRASSVALGRPR